MTSNTATYRKYKMLGLCVLCGAERSGDTLMCEHHRQERILRQRAWYKKNPEYQRKVVRARKYGITPEEVAALLDKQGHKCPICQESLQEYHIDHDHATGLVRGLLCALCNRGLGHFKEKAEVLDRAASYLRLGV